MGLQAGLSCGVAADLRASAAMPSTALPVSEASALPQEAAGSSNVHAADKPAQIGPAAGSNAASKISANTPLASFEAMPTIHAAPALAAASDGNPGPTGHRDRPALGKASREQHPTDGTAAAAALQLLNARIMGAKCVQEAMQALRGQHTKHAKRAAIAKHVPGEPSAPGEGRRQKTRLKKQQQAGAEAGSSLCAQSAALSHRLGTKGCL